MFLRMQWRKILTARKCHRTLQDFACSMMTWGLMPSDVSQVAQVLSASCAEPEPVTNELDTEGSNNSIIPKGVRGKGFLRFVLQMITLTEKEPDTTSDIETSEQL